MSGLGWKAHSTGDPRVTFFRSLTNNLGRELKMRMSPWSLCRQAQACQRPETVLELCSGHQDTTAQPRRAFLSRLQRHPTTRSVQTTAGQHKRALGTGEKFHQGLLQKQNANKIVGFKTQRG